MNADFCPKISNTAGAVGIEPTLAVLETAVLPLNDAPFRLFYSTRNFLKIKCARGAHLFAADPPLFVERLHPAPVAELLIFNLPFHLLLVFVRIVIPPFANGTAKGNKPVGTLYFCHGDYFTMPSLKRQPFGAALLIEPLAGIEPATYSLPWSCSTS